MAETLDWAKKQGLATLLVIVGVGVFTGWIPSPLTTSAALHTLHVAQMDEYLKESRYQTALLATVCANLVDDKTCLTALMREHGRHSAKRLSALPPNTDAHTTTPPLLR